MLTKEIRQTILSLHQAGKSHRTISHLLKISRNTIRKILKQGADIPLAEREDATAVLLPVVRELYIRCQGNAVRVQEILQEEYETKIAYSTLTRLIQQAELRKPPKRAGEYCFEPGLEMQHDTSPHWINFGDKKVKAQCASLVFGFSRRLFMQYYPCFTRFEAKSFLKTAFEFMQGACQYCVIDNTSVILAAGSGADAVIAPEMAVFSRMFGFEFIAHCIGHADRKGKVERPFFYIETNFLAGRTFLNWDDLNQHAKAWCIDVSNKKEKRILGTSPEVAFIKEKPFIIPLPEISPPIYEHYQRIVDSKAFVNLDTNRYSVPEKLIGKILDVYKYPEEVRVLHQHQEVAKHSRLAGKRNSVSVIKEHHIQHHTRNTHRILEKTESALRGHHEILDSYIAQLKRKVRGCGLRPLNRLLSFKQTYPFEAFMSALKQAHHYGLYDLTRLEELIIKEVAGNYFNLNGEKVL